LKQMRRPRRRLVCGWNRRSGRSRWCRPCRRTAPYRGRIAGRCSWRRSCAGRSRLDQPHRADRRLDRRQAARRQHQEQWAADPSARNSVRGWRDNASIGCT
jgi:hypothetical protein